MESTFYIPANLDLDLIVQSRRKDTRENLKWSICYILNALYRMTASKKYRDEFEQHGGYPLNSKLLKEKLGKRYNEAFKILEAAKIITRSKSYSVGKLAKVVGLSAPYSDYSFKKVIMTATTPFSIKLATEQKKWEEKNADALQELEFITKWFSPDYLQLDLEKAHVFIEYYRSEMLSSLESSSHPPIQMEVYKQRINARVNSMIFTANSFSKNEYNLFCTGSDQRLHSILTSTKKELRTLYTFKGQPLVSVDIKASQPYLLNTLLNADFWKTKLENIYPHLSHHLHSPIFHTSHLSPIMLLTLETPKPPFEGKNTSYQDLNWGEGFYEYLVKRATSEGDSKIFATRSKAKSSVMNILYNQEYYMEYTPEFKRFESWFPEIALLVNILNSLSREVSDLEKKKISFLPVLLQRIESCIVLRTTCKRIAKEHPSVPLYPIHDSILTTKENVHIVSRVMEKELYNFVNVNAGLSIEEYNETITFENLRKVAKEDFAEIVSKKKLCNSKIPLSKPLLYSFPQLGESQILSTRFLPTEELYNEHESWD